MFDIDTAATPSSNQVAPLLSSAGFAGHCAPGDPFPSPLPITELHASHAGQSLLHYFHTAANREFVTSQLEPRSGWMTQWLTRPVNTVSVVDKRSADCHRDDRGHTDGGSPLRTEAPFCSDYVVGPRLTSRSRPRSPSSPPAEGGHFSLFPSLGSGGVGSN